MVAFDYSNPLVRNIKFTRVSDLKCLLQRIVVRLRRRRVNEAARFVMFRVSSWIVVVEIQSTKSHEATRNPNFVQGHANDFGLGRDVSLLNTSQVRLCRRV